MVDLMEAHVSDYEAFSCGISTYLERYYIGHYNPRGSLFTALALKDDIMNMLDPEPAPHQPPSWERAR